MSQRDRRHRIRDITGDVGYKDEGVFVQAGRGGHKGNLWVERRQRWPIDKWWFIMVKWETLC